MNPRELINPPALADFRFGAHDGLKAGHRARSEKGQQRTHAVQQRIYVNLKMAIIRTEAASAAGPSGQKRAPYPVAGELF